MMSSTIRSYKTYRLSVLASFQKDTPLNSLLPKLLFIFCKIVTDFLFFVIFKYILNYFSEIKMYSRKILVTPPKYSLKSLLKVVT